jgi:hypothetical protein
LLSSIEIISSGGELRLFKIQDLYLFFSNLLCTGAVEGIILVGKLPFEDDIPGSDDSIQCRYPDSVDVR